MGSQSMQLLLEKISAKDKDFRYMATSDLLTELQKDNFRVDSETERKLCGAMINQLEDTSGDISGLAVKCLGLLVRKVAEVRALDMVSALCDKATAAASKKEAVARDVASIALKTIVGEAAGLHVGTAVAQTITKKLLAGLPKDNADAVSDALEVLSEVEDKMGGVLGAGEHVALRDAMLPLLTDPRAPVRKRAVSCLALSCMYLDTAQLQGAVTPLLAALKQAGLKPDLVRTYVLALGHLSRTVGYRLGPYLSDAVPQVINICSAAPDSDDEMREHCLQALEGFVVHVSIDARGQLDAILGAARANLRYDPNMAQDDEYDGAEDMEGSDAGSEVEEDGDDEEGYSDDEDMSWKVRRASVKLLAAVVHTYTDALPGLYASVATDLLSRFREREESVRVDVYGAFATLARQAGAVSQRFASDDPASPLLKLTAHVPDVSRAVARQLRERSLKSRVACLQLLRELATVSPTAVSTQLPLLAPGIIASLADKSSAGSSLKIEALTFLRQALAAGPQGEQADGGLLKQLTDAVLPCAADRYYKVAAEALRVCEQVIVVLRPLNAPPGPIGSVPFKALYSVLQTRLSAPDQDLEVKEVSISATATAVARAADLLGAELASTLRLLLDRLRNEITRLAAVRGFSTIAASPLHVDLSGPGVLEPLLSELTSFLRKALRPLRLAALLALEALCGKYGPSLPPAALPSLVEEAALLVTDTDLSLAAQALKTLSVLLRTQPAAAPAAAAKALPAGLALVRSPLLQGAALDQLNAFFTALAATGTPGAGVDDQLAALLAQGRQLGAAARTAQLAVAQCVAVLASSAGTAKVGSTASGLLSEVTGAAGGVPSQRLALLCLGELGRRADLSGLPAVLTSVQSSLGSEVEDIKGAASLALGGVTCGNLEHFLPGLLQSVSSSSSPKLQYLLLSALNEVLITCSAPPMPSLPGAQPAPLPRMSDSAQQSCLSLLLSLADTTQEECRLVIAECLGRLALLNPAQVLAKLAEKLADPSVGMRAVVVSSLKYMVTDRPHAIDAPLSSSVHQFLSLMTDPSHVVRRAAVVSLSAIAHQKPAVVAGGRDGAPPPLQVLLPSLYQQTVVREDLIRTVDLGPFKHKIDDGLELRKAAFEALDILLDHPACTPLLDMAIFTQHLGSGLKDHADIKAPCHLMLVKACGAAPGAVLAAAEQLVPALEATLTTRLKSDAVKQEVDRHEDMLRGCLRGVHALSLLSGIEGVGAFAAFLKRVVLTGPMRDRYEQVQREWADSAGSDPMEL